MDESMLKTITINDTVRLCVLDNHAYDRQPMLFLHGLTGNHLQLQHYIKHFSSRYRTISVDFRGRGNSGHPESHSSLTEHAKDIMNLIDVLELKNVICVGYSMGAFVASIVAQHPKVSKLVLLDGMATMDDHQDAIVSPTFARLSNRYESRQGYIDLVSANYAKMGIPLTSDLIKVLSYEIYESVDGWKNKAFEETIRQDWASFYQFDVSKTAESIHVPCLLVQALGSIGSNPALFLERHYVSTNQSIPNLRVYQTDASHYTLVFTKRDDVLNEMEEFLK